MNEKKGLTASGVKLIAMICMFIDHFAGSVYQGLLFSNRLSSGLSFYDSFYALDRVFCSPEGLFYLFLRAIGRLSFPIYCFFIVEGFKYTRSRWKYLMRLACFALISEVPFDLAIFGKFIYPNYQNVYFTLAIGLAMIWAIDKLSTMQLRKWVRILLRIGAVILAPLAVLGVTYYTLLDLVRYVFKELDDAYFALGLLAAYVLAVASLLTALIVRKKTELTDKLAIIFTISGIACFLADQTMFVNVQTDYGALGILTILVLYLLRTRKDMSITFACALLGVINYMELPSFLALPLIKHYNGEKGNGNKFLFYIFYPAHLLVLGLFCYFAGINPLG